MNLFVYIISKTSSFKEKYTYKTDKVLRKTGKDEYYEF